MPGWTAEKRQRTEAAFYQFLARCYINSRDYGRVCLGENLYWGQREVIKQIFDALQEDVHKVYILKSRQLGVSTLIRALTVFLTGISRGLKGAIVFDTDFNKEESRSELATMIDELPKSLKFPTVQTNNRVAITLQNQSKVLFFAAGTKKTKSGGTLGRSVGLSIVHSSEICSWDNEEGLEAFENSLSDINPDRLYIYESTARGFNAWFKMWTEARKDPAHCRCIFLGWWSKDTQRIERDHPDWAMYGEQSSTEKEAQKIKYVAKHYGFEVAQEQLAWVRRKMDPSAQKEGDAEPEFEGSAMRVQEQPWVEMEAFQQTGSIFFPSDKLTELSAKYATERFQAYMFLAGAEFFDMRVMKANSTKQMDLKVWEEPVQDSTYVMGIDPAYGENEDNDRSSIQVCRCYADGLDQVAEYASPLVNTKQLAWVIAALIGWYGEGNNKIKYALELNGPGQAVFNELRSMRQQIDSGYQLQQYQERGLQDIFRNVRTYIYTRPDGIGVGSSFHIKTQVQLKILFMNRLRDFVTNGGFHVKSLDLIDEMKTIAQEGDSISAPKSMRDDRVLAAAFAVHCWEEGPRKELISQKWTRETDTAKRRSDPTDLLNLYHKNQLQAFFDTKRQSRQIQWRTAQRRSWRHG